MANEFYVRYNGEWQLLTEIYKNNIKTEPAPVAPMSEVVSSVYILPFFVGASEIMDAPINTAVPDLVENAAVTYHT